MEMNQHKRKASFVEFLRIPLSNYKDQLSVECFSFAIWRQLAIYNVIEKNHPADDDDDDAMRDSVYIHE